MLVPTLALFLTGVAGTLAPAPGSADTLARVRQDPAIAIRLDRNGEYDPGHDAQVNIQTELDGYLLVIHADPQGRLRVLFPLEPYDDAFVEGGRDYDLVNRGGRGSFFVTDAEGYGTVFAALSEWPFHVAAFAEDHRWDYERLWVSPDGDIEDGLVDLVAGMAYDGWFDYDLVQYEVYGSDSYASEASYAVYADAGPCCGTSVGVSIVLGDPYWPYYGPPYYYASVYRPYWYPYYYGSYYVYRPRYRYPYYRGYSYGGSYRYAGGRNYRFKPPYRYDSDRRLGDDPYRRRGVGIDASRGPGGSGDIDYRGRRSPTTERRARPGTGRSRPTITQASGGRRLAPNSGGRRTGPVTPSGGQASPGRTTGGRRASPSPRTTGSTGDGQSPGRRPVGPRDGNDRTFEKFTGRKPTLSPRTSPRGKPSAQPPRRPTASGTKARSSGRPVLRRQEPRTVSPGTGPRGNRTAQPPRRRTTSGTKARPSGRPVLRRQEPRAPSGTRSARPSRDRMRATTRPAPVRSAPRRTANRPTASPRGRPSVSRRPAARSPSRSASKSTSRRRPR